MKCIYGLNDLNQNDLSGQDREVRIKLMVQIQIDDNRLKITIVRMIAAV